MPTVGAGVEEIRIHTGVEHRVFYLARFEESVYVLHVFEKRGRKTATRNLQLGRQRHAAVITRRRRE